MTTKTKNRAYWEGFYSELLRLDAKKCVKGTACGNACIPDGRQCRQASETPQQQARTQRISELSGGGGAESQSRAAKPTSPQKSEKDFPEERVYEARAIKGKKRTLKQRVKEKAKRATERARDLLELARSAEAREERAINKDIERNLTPSERRARDEEKKHVAMVKKLRKNLPDGVEAHVRGDGDGFLLRTKTSSGDTIEFGISGADGVYFTVNNKFDAGSVGDRKAQTQVALTVRNLWDTTIASLPDGYQLRTSALTRDGKGKMRADAYVKMGFSRPSEKPGDTQYAVVRSGKVVPSDSRGNPLVKTDSDRTDAKPDMTRLWYQAIFGEDPEED